MKPECHLPSPFDREKFELLRSGISDNPLIKVFINEKKDFAFLSPLPKIDYNNYVPRVNKLKKGNYKKELNIIERRFNKICPYLTESASVLEIGAADGVLLSYLKSRFSEVTLTAVEKDINTFQKRKEIVGQNNFYDIEELIDKGRTFSFVCLFHVLEHIEVPNAFLSQIGKVMAPDSILAVEVPSLYDPLISLYENDAYLEFYFQEQHPYIYSHDSLRRLMEFIGFKTEKVIPFQRYGLENHLNWLAKGKPGGNHTFRSLFGSLNDTYIEALELSEKTDSVIWVGTQEGVGGQRLGSWVRP